MKFPMTEQQVHEAYLTDPKVHMLATIFQRVREACEEEIDDVQMAALAVYALERAGKVHQSPPPSAAIHALVRSPTQEAVARLLRELRWPE